MHTALLAVLLAAILVTPEAAEASRWRNSIRLAAEDAVQENAGGTTHWAFLQHVNDEPRTTLGEPHQGLLSMVTQVQIDNRVGLFLVTILLSSVYFGSGLHDKTGGLKSAWNIPVLQWLAILSLQAWAVVGLQSLLGWWTGSIELLADVPHSAVDAFTYSLNCGLECMKLFSNGHRAPFVYDLGGVISVLALLAVTAFIVYEALGELKHAPLSIWQVEDDPRGRAMLVFAIVTLASNVALLALYRYWGLTMSKDSGKQNEALLSQDTPSADETADLAAVFGTAKRAGWRKKSGFTNMQLLHGVLHPGCVDTDCLETLAFELPESGPQDSTESGSVSLNLGAAVLHLISDLLRAVTVLLSGILIQSRLLNATYVDVIGSFFIAGFNLLGLGALVVKAVRG